MAVLSKAAWWLGGGQTLRTNCYETFHTWEPDCTWACIDAIPDALKFCLRTYGSLYLATVLITNKFDVKKISWKRVVTDTIRSTIFLTCNLIFYLSFLCRIRQLTGYFCAPNIGYLNGVVSSFFALLVEKRSRRPALALYLTNLASETLFRQLTNHGYLKNIPHGTFIPFSIGLALLKYLSNNGSLDKMLKGLLSVTLQDGDAAENAIVSKYGRRIKKALPPTFREVIERLKKEGRTEECDHEHSCVYNASKRFAHNASVGLALSSALTIVSNIKKIARSPTQLVRLLLSGKNLRIPLFFGLAPLIYHASRCTMNRWKIEGGKRDIVSALAAGSALAAYPSVSIAMFTMWKGIEALYGDLVEKGYLKWIKHGDIVLYSLSTGYVLGCAALEPHAIRTGYIHFLEELTGDRIKKFHRHHYDHFGYDSTKLYGVQHFKVDPKYTSEYFPSP